MTENRPIGVGDLVRIRGTPATLATDVAGLIGEVQGTTAPSKTNVEVIGQLQEDYAIHVQFDGRKEAYWFAPICWSWCGTMLRPTPQLAASIRIAGRRILKTRSSNQG